MLLTVRRQTNHAIFYCLSLRASAHIIGHHLGPRPIRRNQFRHFCGEFHRALSWVRLCCLLKVRYWVGFYFLKLLRDSPQHCVDANVGLFEESLFAHRTHEEGTGPVAADAGHAEVVSTRDRDRVCKHIQRDGTVYLLLR